MFTWEETELAEVPVFVRQDGAVSPLPSHVLSCLKAQYETRRAFRAAANAFVEVLNEPGGATAIEKYGHLLFSTEPNTVREFVERMLKRTMKCRFADLAGGRHGRSVKVKGKKVGKLKLVLSVVKKVLALLFRQGVLSRNASLIDGYDTETAVVRELKRLKAEMSRNKARGADDDDDGIDWRRDDGSYFRMSKQIWVPKRTEDVRWFGRIMVALEKAGAIPSVLLCTRFIGQSGRRSGREAVPATMLGWWTGSRLGLIIKTACKGGGDEEDLDTPFTASLHDQLVAMVDGWRRHRDPKRRGMAEFVELGRRADAGDAEAEAELAEARIFLNEAGGDLTYEVYHDHFSRAMDGADVFIPATPHWLRHEHVFNRMRAIEAANYSRAEYRRAREALAAHMGWTTPDMLRCYDAFWANLRKLEDAAANAARAEAEACAALAGRIDVVTVAPVRQSPARNHELRAYLES